MAVVPTAWPCIPMGFLGGYIMLPLYLGCFYMMKAFPILQTASEKLLLKYSCCASERLLLSCASWPQVLPSVMLPSFPRFGKAWTGSAAKQLLLQPQVESLHPWLELPCDLELWSAAVMFCTLLSSMNQLLDRLARALCWPLLWVQPLLSHLFYPSYMKTLNAEIAAAWQGNTDAFEYFVHCIYLHVENPSLSFWLIINFAWTCLGGSLKFKKTLSIMHAWAPLKLP